MSKTALTSNATLSYKEGGFQSRKESDGSKPDLKLSFQEGNVKLPKTYSPNPVKKAYELWGNNALKNGRSSWDQIAVLFAARPQYFNIREGKLIQNDYLETYWKPASDKASSSYSHFKVVPSISNEDMEAVIEELMSEKPLISINQK